MKLAVSMGIQMEANNQNTATEAKGKTKTGADLFIETLQKEKVEVIFGYPGGAVLPIYDALHKNPMRHVF